MRSAVLWQLNKSIKDQIFRTLNLLHTYQVGCTSPSDGEKWLRSEIYSMFGFGSLLEYTTTLSERVKLVHEEAEKQERRLLSLYENY